MEKKFTSAQADHTHYIHGTTNINHKIRVQLGLAVHEYCILDFLQGWYSKNEKNPQGSDFYNWMGITVATILANLVDLKDRGFIQDNGDENNLRPGEKWMKAFELKDEFEQLWKLHAKGNKKTAKQRFTKVIKKIPFEALLNTLEKYIKSNDFEYLKGLDVWLNPDKEHWNDPIVIKKAQYSAQETLIPPGIDESFLTDV